MKTQIATLAIVIAIISVLISITGCQQTTPNHSWLEVHEMRNEIIDMHGVHQTTYQSRSITNLPFRNHLKFCESSRRSLPRHDHKGHGKCDHVDYDHEGQNFAWTK